MVKGKCYKNTPASSRVNIFMNLGVWFEDYVIKEKIPFKPWCFWGQASHRQGNTYFEFGNIYNEFIVDGKKCNNIVKNSYTIFWQEHRSLEEYKKMVIDSFNEWKEVIYD